MGIEPEGEAAPSPADGRWRVWRQDDNGHRVPMTAFAREEDARAEVRRLEALGHKQTYWAEREK